MNPQVSTGYPQIGMDSLLRGRQRQLRQSARARLECDFSFEAKIFRHDTVSVSPDRDTSWGQRWMGRHLVPAQVKHLVKHSVEVSMQEEGYMAGW